MRRFTRLANGFSKKIENLEHAVALHFMYYNFARPHKTLANPYPRTPAMEAGVNNHVWSIEEIVRLAGLANLFNIRTVAESIDGTSDNDTNSPQ